jgi:hypothetical protein
MQTELENTDPDNVKQGGIYIARLAQRPRQSNINKKAIAAISVVLFAV